MNFKLIKPCETNTLHYPRLWVKTEGLQWVKASCLLFLQYPSFNKYTPILCQPIGWILRAQDYIQIEFLLSKFSQPRRGDHKGKPLKAEV